MGKIRVESRLRLVSPQKEQSFMRRYDAEGALIETHITCSESDYFDGCWERRSTDNGRTWGEWQKIYSDEDGRRGRVPGSAEGDEYLADDVVPTLYDPISGCKFGIGSDAYFIRGHDVGYFDYWEKGEDNMRTHAYYALQRPDGRIEKHMFEFEEGGADYDPENPRNPAFLDKNRASVTSLRILPDGDLGFLLYPTVRLCCKMAGVDVKGFFPSCPDFQVGLLYARAHWNAEKQDYDITYSNPIMLSDLQSSRGIGEPALFEPENGRIFIFLRGSNWVHEAWHTRIDPCAPGYKWYVVSDDGGRTFCPPMPMHYDTREILYSPASICKLFRSTKTGKTYWIGNIIDDPRCIDGNDPRWILQICEVDPQYGYLLKDTLTVIDGRRDGQTYVELSNFDLLENRETLDLEVRLTKCNFNGGRQEEGDWYTEAWEYTVHFDD